MTEPSVLSANGKNFNTRVTTKGARHAIRLSDHRNAWARRDRELFTAIANDLGGHERLSELQVQIVRRAVGLAIQCEQIEVALCEGEKPDPVVTVSLINCFNRTANLLGLKRIPKEVQDLEAYVGSRYGKGAEIEGEAAE